MEDATLTSSARLRAILLLIFLKPSFSKTVVVKDGVVQANVVTLFLGDTLVFKGDGNFHVIYIFRSRKAFQLCNLNKATILHSANTTTSFTWHPSVPGNFYFSSRNTTNNDQCDDWKVKVKVMGLKLPPSISSQSPSPTPGGDVRWPSPQQGPMPTAKSPMSLPTSTPSSSTSSSPSRYSDSGHRRWKQGDNDNGRNQDNDVGVFYDGDFYFPDLMNQQQRSSDKEHQLLTTKFLVLFSVICTFVNQRRLFILP